MNTVRSIRSAVGRSRIVSECAQNVAVRDPFGEDVFETFDQL